MRWLALLVLVLPLPSLAHLAQSKPAWKAVPRYAHVVVVIEENKSFSTIIGSRDAPYINQLAGQGVLFTDAHAITHPSEPNYLALFAGSTEGVIDDSCPHEFDGPQLASILLKHKLRFAIYSENMPSAGFTGCGADGGLYRRKHNPVANWQSHLPAAANEPFSAFPKHYSHLPTVAFVVPNMMNDMHDGSIAQGDTWLRENLDAYAKWAGTHDSLLIITWDESDGASDTNRIPMLMIGAHLKSGSSAQYLTHYNLLRTLTEMYGLKPVGEAAAAQPISSIWSH